MLVRELKEFLNNFDDDMKVVSSSVFRRNFEDLKGEPIKRLVRKKLNPGSDWVEYEPLYSTQAEQAEEEVLVIW